MQSAVDRVMEAYTLMVTLTPDEQKVTRQRLERHLAAMDADEKALAVEGLRYLRGRDRVSRRRKRARPDDGQLSPEGAPDRRKKVG
jgi:hypothetical protein